jgi:hypothetical protein
MTRYFKYWLGLYTKAVGICDFYLDNKINESTTGGMFNAHGRNQEHLHILIVRHKGKGPFGRPTSELNSNIETDLKVFKMRRYGSD